MNNKVKIRKKNICMFIIVTVLIIYVYLCIIAKKLEAHVTNY